MCNFGFFKRFSAPAITGPFRASLWSGLFPKCLSDLFEAWKWANRTAMGEIYNVDMFAPLWVGVFHRGKATVIVGHGGFDPSNRNRLKTQITSRNWPSDSPVLIPSIVHRRRLGNSSDSLWKPMVFFSVMPNWIWCIGVNKLVPSKKRSTKRV